MTNKTKAFINYVLVTSLFFLCQNCSYAQDSLSRYLNNNYYSFNGLDKYMKDDFIATYKNQLGLTDDDDLIEQNSITDDKGRSETRYQQYYKGYLVEGSSLSLHADKGVVLAAGGNLVKNLNVDIENPISEATALTAALSYLNASEYYWQDSLLENGYKELSENSNATYYPKREFSNIYTSNELI